MVKFFYQLKELDLEQLMCVYSQTLENDSRERYPAAEPSEGFLHARQDLYCYLREVFFRTKGAFYAVAEENGTYLSALRMEPYKDGLLLAGIETAPKYRRKGYARMLMERVLSRTSGSRIYSHVSKRNGASVRLHEGCGFQKISDSAVYIDGSVSHRAITLFYHEESADKILDTPAMPESGEMHP